jgi:hypothetical protein
MSPILVTPVPRNRLKSGSEIIHSKGQWAVTDFGLELLSRPLTPVSRSFCPSPWLIADRLRPPHRGKLMGKSFHGVWVMYLSHW